MSSACCSVAVKLKASSMSSTSSSNQALFRLLDSILSSTEQELPDSRGSAYLHTRQMLESLLNKSMRIRMTDGRTLIGLFLCTDRDCNVILGSAQEYLKPTDSLAQGEPRVLGLAMIPGHHVVSIEVEMDSVSSPQYM
ncbi:N-alpha-acetyltransferase 38, NatC auxiliary subunit-like [Heterodontus francisci]|uniref:N-alpha-acetyltransferase 38, NatC auxiliary subunit-like n=1 Tax=Heterodontus francisci TaxID=7792 RepID=UPI00355B5D35